MSALRFPCHRDGRSHGIAHVVPEHSDEGNKTMKLDRRSFVGGAGMAAGAAALGGAGMALADEAAQPWMPEKWDRETDVVVVGTGSIIAAALRAHDLGLEVLVLEKSPDWFGGTTALCGGGLFCPNSTGALEQGSREIPRDLLKEYCMDVAEGQTSEELVDMMLDNCALAVDYLNDECGFQWVSFPPSPNKSFNIYYPFPQMEGEYSDVSTYVSIGTHEATGKYSGRAITEYSKDAVAARNIEVLMGTAATKLIYAGNPALGDGEVIGLWATDSDGNEIATKARYAVVLGTGGFDQNQEMVRHYLNHPIYSTCAVPTNTGDGHIMAMELGANMRNMNDAFYMNANMKGDPTCYTSTHTETDDGNMGSEASVAFLNSGAVGSITVNKHGERFGCEGASYDLAGRAWDTYDTGRRDWRNIPGYMIMDGTYAGPLGVGGGNFQAMLSSGEFPEWIHSFETMEELADGMGIDKEGLLATVERWNAMCAEGVDKDWNRGEGTWDKFTMGNLDRVESGELKNPCMAPLDQGPFYCMEIHPGMLQTAGGMEINANAQVKNVRGEVIPRLYAGSCCIANVLGRGYPGGGTTLANGFVVGYVAANHIATLQPWE